jgi:methylenetetrahydrofolate dehydrogenase (NADP+)/methenyltetrahydrofolate cyclohydrolase
MPEHIKDESLVKNTLSVAKDVDGMTIGSLGGMFMNSKVGYPPCTPQACMEILDHFKIDVKGKRAVVIGHSLVVGKPAASLLLNRDATIAVCHEFTGGENAASISRGADIVIIAVGRARMFGKDYFREGQIVIDVGINFDENGKLCGDVNFDEVEPIVAGITPVPGGVGTVTTSVLVKHVVEAAKAGS